MKHVPSSCIGCLKFMMIFSLSSAQDSDLSSVPRMMYHAQAPSHIQTVSLRASCWYELTILCHDLAGNLTSSTCERG